MDEESNLAHRDRLLGDFRRSLTKPLSERFFDEGDLIEIFDYAGDLGDDYLRMEALLCAARFYPDSEEMKQRRAVFYWQYGDDVCQRFLGDNTAERGLLWDIMRVRKSAPAGDEADRSLDFLLSSYDDLTDEEVIQLVDLASSLGRYPWLKEHMDQLRRKAGYLVMLLYEVAVAADSAGDREYSVQLLEELTDTDPFNHTYWQMLAKEEFAAGHLEKALTAVDYALAINADDTQSQLVKANLLYTTGHPIKEVEQYALGIINREPDWLDAVKFLGSVYGETHQYDKAVALLTAYVDAYPDQAPYVVPELITYRPDDTDRLLDIFYRNTDDTSRGGWGSWAQNLAANGFADLAEKVIDCYQRNSGQPLVLSFAIDRAFAAGDSEAVLQGIHQYLDELHNQETSMPALVAMHIVSLLRMGRISEALTFMSTIEIATSINGYIGTGQRLEYLGLRQVMREIRSRLALTKDPADWQDYDPLEMSPL